MPRGVRSAARDVSGTGAASITGMRSVTQLGTVLTAALLSLPFAAARARACSGLECTPSVYFPSSGTVPANLPGFYWWPSDGFARAGQDSGASDPVELVALVRFARVDGATPEFLEVEVREPDGSWAKNGPHLIVPKAPLVPGGTYVLWDATRACLELPSLEVPPAGPQFSDGDFGPSFHTGQARIEAAAAAALPGELGELTAGAPMASTIWAPSGSGCSGKLEVEQSELAIDLAASAKPWADALFYRSEVDGEPYNPVGEYHQRALDYDPGTSLAGRAREFLYTDCNGGEGDVFSEGVDEGAHRALIRAVLPGSDLELHTNEVNVALACETPAADAGKVGAGKADAGERARRDAEDSGADDGDGCSVSVTSGTNSWPLAIALWLLARRRLRTRHA